MSSRWTWFGVIATLVSGCGDTAQVDDIRALEGDATNGEAVFGANCASCHGVDGTGGSGPNIIGEAGEDDAEWVEIILGGEDTMPAFVDVLTDQEIADVLAWLKS
jgi:cytochrome c551